MLLSLQQQRATSSPLVLGSPGEPYSHQGTLFFGGLVTVQGNTEIKKRERVPLGYQEFVRCIFLKPVRLAGLQQAQNLSHRVVLQILKSVLASFPQKHSIPVTAGRPIRGWPVWAEGTRRWAAGEHRTASRAVYPLHNGCWASDLYLFHESEKAQTLNPKL